MEVYLKGLVNALKDEHQVRVFTRSTDQSCADGELSYQTEEGVSVTRLHVDLRQLSTFSDLYQRDRVDRVFREFLMGQRPDVCHIHHLGGLSLGMIHKAGLMDIPVVMTLHDHAPFCPRGQRIRDDMRLCRNIQIEDCLDCLKPQTMGSQSRTSKLALYLLAKERGMRQLKLMHDDIGRAFDRVACFITPSEFHKEKVAEMGIPSDKIEVLPCGLNLSVLESVPPRPAGQPVRRFGYMGTLTPSKGVEDAIRAFHRMKVPGCSLHIHGEAVPYHGIKDYDKRLMEMADNADVTFYGRYQPDQLPEVVADLDAIVMPSRWYESYGITIREAFRSGRPVIASDIGAFSEAVRHMKNGLKYTHGDVFELAEMMDKLAKDSDLADKLSRESGHVESLAAHKQKLLDLYQRVLEQTV